MNVTNKDPCICDVALVEVMTDPVHGIQNSKFRQTDHKIVLMVEDFIPDQNM